MLWWRSRTETWKKSIFRWFSRTKTAPDSLLKISLPERIPAPVGFVPTFTAGPLAPGWLMRGSAHIPEPVTNINLLSIHDHVSNAGTHNNFEGEGRTPLGIRPTGSSGPREDDIPPLVDRLRILLTPPKTFPTGENAVLEWPTELMPFQHEGVRILLNSSRILLADDMGLGKTLQTIAALRILLARGLIKKVLIITPVSVLDQWRDEFAKWAREVTALIIRGYTAERQRRWRSTDHVHVALVGYESFLSDLSYNNQSVVKENTWDVVVLDEAQRIKNRNSRISNAVKGLKRRRSWALTGTPIENKVDELASIMEFVDHTESGEIRSYQSGLELQQRHKELQLRRKKRDVLPDLPPKQVAKLKVALSPSQQASYEKAEADGIVHLRELGREVKVTHVLELITRLKQICNADPESGESCKFDDIKERIARLVEQGHKALVFSQYTSEAYGVKAAVDALQDFEPLSLTGTMPHAERTAIIQRFKTLDKYKVLVISLMAGGQGLNLQEASYVFHLDRWWNPAVERQAEDRSHRFGQTVPVNVIKYSCIGTIEERIDTILEGKQELFDRLIDDVSIDISNNLTSKEFFGLFGLESPTPREPRVP